MNSNIAKERFDWVDRLKGILILLVILNHSYCPLEWFKYYSPVFLSMFFLASGFTFSPKKNWTEFLKNKFIRLFIPFICLGLIRILMTVVLTSHPDISYGAYFIHLVKKFLIQINFDEDELWFVAAMIVCVLLYRLVWVCGDKLSKHIPSLATRFILTSIISLLGMLDIVFIKYKFPWQLELAAVLLFYMEIGYEFRHSLPEKIKLMNGIACLLAAAIYITTLILTDMDISFRSETFEPPVGGFFIVLLGGYVLVYISQKLTFNPVAGFLKYMGQNTLFYYAFAGTVRMIFFPIMHYCDVYNDYVLSVICMLITPLVLYIPCWIVNHFFPWLVGKPFTTRAYP